MGRPKGSKNKEKAEKTAEKPVVSEAPKEIPKATKPTGHPIWTPKPDMGAIKPPDSSVSLCAACGHVKSLHYGSEKNWCNVCSCQAWTE